MSHTHASCLFHCIFSTKYRRKTIAPELKERLWAFLGGVARKNDMKALAVGGTENHVHILLSVPAAVPLAKAVQLIKGGSSKWVHETFPANHDFSWQEGYGAFSVGISQVGDTVAYIQKQEEHHRTRSFEEEFIAFLKKHRIEYDERFVWG
jgi:putative transposase